MTRTVTVGLRLNADGFHTEAARASRSVEQLNRQVTGLGRSRGFQQATGGAHTFRNALGAIAGAGVGAGLVKLVTDSTRAAASFDTTMRQIAVATNDTTGRSIKSLSALAMKMGQDTVFSAQDAGSAMLELAKGGMNQAQIKAGALSSTLTLASAGGLQLSDAAGYVVQGLSLFNLQADKSASVAAALAGGANASTASVQDMGLALSQVGPGAKLAGLTLQETTGVLAAFAQNGIKGSDAGTSLKTMLARLVPQTTAAKDAMKALGLHFTDAHGRFRDISDIAEQLHAKLGGLSAAQRTTALNTIFGSDASRAAAILMKEGAAGVRDYTRATSDQTQAQKLAKAATTGTAGALSQLSGSVDTAKLQLGQALAPLIVDLANHTTTWTNELSTSAIPKLERFIRGMENGTGPGGEFADTLGNIAHTGQEMWHGVEPFFSFMLAHPHLLTQVAKDAAILAAALKVRGAVGGITGLGTAAGGAGAVGAASRGQIVGRGLIGGGVGAVVGATTHGTGGAAVYGSMGTAAMTGLVTGGLPGAVLGVTADALVLGLTKGARDAARDKKFLDAFHGALAGATSTAQVQSIGTSATDPVVKQVLRMHDVSTAKGLAAALKDLATIGGPKEQLRTWQDAVQSVADAYRGVHMDSLQAANAQQRLINLGLNSAASMNKAATGLAKAPSDSVDRLTARFPHLVVQAHSGTDSLHALERQISAIPGPSTTAQTSLHALEQQIARVEGNHTITITMLQHLKTVNPTAAADPEIRRIRGSLTNKATGGYISGPGTGTSDDILARLSNGEFVVNAKATARNLHLLKAINDGVPGFAAGGHVITNYNPRAGSISRQATYVRRQGGTVDDINTLMASYDAYLAHLDQVKQRAQLVSAYVHAQAGADKAQAKRDLTDFDAQTRIDRERAAVDKLTASMQKAADVETHRRTIMDNRYRLGLISGAAEAADLDKRMAKLEKYSDEWMALYDQKQQILGDTRQKQLDTVTFRYPYAGVPAVTTPVRGAGSSGSSSTSYDQRTSAQIVVQKDSTAKDLVRELAWLRR